MKYGLCDSLRGMMLPRPLLTLSFALFFATLVPLALACELAARGGDHCAGVACDASGPAVHCASDRATHAVAPSKPDGDGIPHLPAAGLASGTFAPSMVPRHVPAARVPPHRPNSPPATLVSLAVLLRI